MNRWSKESCENRRQTAFHDHVNGTDANRPWRLRIQLESSSFFSLFLSFSLSFLFSSTDGNFSSHDALACPIPRWFNRGRGVSLLFRPWSLESSNLVHWITRRQAVINEIFCNLWPSSRCWRSTQLRSIYSYRERRRWAKLIFIYLKKKRKKRKEKNSLVARKIIFYWNFFHSLLIFFSYEEILNFRVIVDIYEISTYVEKKGKFTRLWQKIIFFLSILLRDENWLLR